MLSLADPSPVHVLTESQIDTEARLFKRFSQSVETLTSNTPRQEAMNIVDPVKEIALLREIKDITDELKTMDDIFRTQSKVIGECVNVLADHLNSTLMVDSEMNLEEMRAMERRLRTHWGRLSGLIRTQQVDESDMADQAKVTAQAVGSPQSRASDSTSLTTNPSGMSVERPYRPQAKVLQRSRSPLGAKHGRGDHKTGNNAHGLYHCHHHICKRLQQTKMLNANNDNLSSFPCHSWPPSSPSILPNFQRQTPVSNWGSFPSTSVRHLLIHSTTLEKH